MARGASMTCEEFLDLASAAALDSASEIEVRRVEEHARKCPECGTRYDELREVVAALGSLVPQVEAPGSVREELFETVRRERVPITRRIRLSPAWLVAAASMVVSVAALVWVAMLEGQIADLQRSMMMANDRAARYDHVVAVLASDSLKIRPLQPAVQTMPSRGMVYMDPSSGTGMVMCHNLPPIEQGHAYQIWFVRGDQRVSGGLLWPDRSGNGYTVIRVPNDLQDFDSIGVTDEPGTGSAGPTTQRVLGTPLRESTQ